MTTIQIIREGGIGKGRIHYRAIHRNSQANGATPGKALDALEETSPDLMDDADHAIVILHRFMPDGFFSAEQQARLTDLLTRRRAAQVEGCTLSSNEENELARLVEAELLGSARRAQSLFAQTTTYE